MTDHDDLLNELDTALRVEPSRAFADGVRAKVRRSQVRTTQMWWGLAAAATVGFAVMTLWRPTHEVPAPVTTSASVPAPSATPALAPFTAPISSVGGRVFRPGKPSVAQMATTATSEPRLEVITNQPAVLRQLWADARGRRLEMVEADPAVDGMSPKPIVVNPIEVRPIVVNEIGKEPGPGGASPIIRRVNATKETK